MSRDGGYGGLYASLRQRGEGGSPAVRRAGVDPLSRKPRQNGQLRLTHRDFVDVAWMAEIEQHGLAARHAGSQRGITDKDQNRRAGLDTQFVEWIKTGIARCDLYGGARNA